jgi:hypothetical protein
MEDLEKEVEASGGWVINTGVKGIVTTVIIVFIRVEVGDGFVRKVGGMRGLSKVCIGFIMGISHGKVDANNVRRVVVGSINFKGFDVIG